MEQEEQEEANLNEFIDKLTGDIVFKEKSLKQNIELARVNKKIFFNLWKFINIIFEIDAVADMVNTSESSESSESRNEYEQLSSKSEVEIQKLQTSIRTLSLDNSSDNIIVVDAILHFFTKVVKTHYNYIEAKTFYKNLKKNGVYFWKVAELLIAAFRAVKNKVENRTYKINAAIEAISKVIIKTTPSNTDYIIEIDIGQRRDRPYNIYDLTLKNLHDEEFKYHDGTSNQIKSIKSKYIIKAFEVNDLNGGLSIYVVDTLPKKKETIIQTPMDEDALRDIIDPILTDIENDINNSQHVPLDDARQVEIKFKTVHEYYLVVIILTIIDVLHDFRKGFRNNEYTKYWKNKTEKFIFLDNIKRYLKEKFEALQHEWKTVHKIINEDPNTELFDIIGEYGENLWETGEGLERNTLNIIKRAVDLVIDPKNKTRTPNDKLIYNTDAVELYQETKDHIKSITQNQGAAAGAPVVEELAEESGAAAGAPQRKNLRFISNNACGIGGDTTTISLGFEDINIMFDQSQSNGCKALPASLYDGADGGTCGTLKSALTRGALEIGNSKIKFTFDIVITEANQAIQTLTASKPYLSFNTYYRKEPEVQQESQQAVDVLYEYIFVERKEYKANDATLIHKANYKIKIMDRNGMSDKVKMDEELLGYYHPEHYDYRHTNHGNEYNYGTITQGFFGKFIREENKDVDSICFIRKALCDFKQYLNGIFKGGAYNYFIYEKNILNPPGNGVNSKFFTTYTNYNGDRNRTISLDYTREGKHNGNFPFLAMHGDQPATALNLLLLACCPIEKVNKYSHTTFVLSNYINRDQVKQEDRVNLVFGNPYGNIIIIPFNKNEKKKGKRCVGIYFN